MSSLIPLKQNGGGKGDTQQGSLAGLHAGQFLGFLIKRSPVMVGGSMTCALCTVEAGIAASWLD